MDRMLFDGEPELDSEQEAFAAAAAGAAAAAVTGPPGSGKTHALLARLIRQAELAPEGRMLVLTTASTAPLHDVFAERLDPELAERCVVCTPLEFAAYALRTHYREAGFSAPPRIAGEAAARMHFTELAQPLLNLTWPALRNGEIDPEVSGIRNPERFLSATYTLFEKLRAAGHDPLHISEPALRGTTKFYAAPPNFADAELIRATKDAYRDSLRVDFQALDHQRRREADLTAIIAELARAQDTGGREGGLLAPQQALFMLVEALQRSPEFAGRLREFAGIYIDEAQDLRPLENRLLTTLFGVHWSSVAFAADARPQVPARGADDGGPLARAGLIVELQHRYRGTPLLWTIHRTALAAAGDPVPADSVEATESGSVRVFRAPDRRSEATAVADALAAAVASGIAPGACAVLLRSLRCAGEYVDAIVRAGLPVDVAGAVDPLSNKPTADVYALLRALCDRNDSGAFLRLAASPLLALNDRDTALLCTPPGEPALFALETPARSRSARATDQLASNLLSGFHDDAFEPEIRARLAGFRAQWTQWQARIDAGFDDRTLLDLIVESGLVGGTPAEARSARSMTARFLTRLAEIQHESPQQLSLPQLLERFAALHRTLAYESGAPVDRDAIIVACADALRGYDFDFVAIADARAGAFPRYYVPDAFLYSPSRGFIPRENVGTRGALRTAKFTWYLHAVRARENYNREERRIFASAIARTRKHLLISASGSATRGLTSPELLEEIRRAGIAGIVDLTIRHK